MRIPDSHVLAITFELTQADFALSAVDHLTGNTSTSAVTGLLEVLYEPVAAKVAVAAIQALAAVEHGHPLSAAIRQAAVHGVNRAESTVQIACIRQLQKWQENAAAKMLKLTLQTSPKWIIRRAALLALIDIQPALAASAATDPHWRVRHALINAAGQADDTHAELTATLHRQSECNRANGVAAYLAGADAEPSQVTSPLASLPCWDIDSSVFFRELKKAPADMVLRDDNTLSQLLEHADERIRKWAVSQLGAHGELRHLRGVANLLAEPRLPAAAHARHVIQRLDASRRDAILQAVPAAALINASTVEAPPPWHVKTSAMTREEAAAIVANPVAENSWRVIRHAAKLNKTPLWEIEPAKRWQPLQQPPAPPDVVFDAKPPEVDAPRGLPLLAISGHYGLPEAGFQMAFDAGADLMFWEPNYNSMTGFFRHSSPALRRRIRMMVGTFEADATGIRRDVERALRLLKIPRIYFFMMFWVKTWKRINDEVRRTLEDLVSEGKVHTYGLSTHSYSLATDAITTGWNPIMVRHNAAHRGAEENVFHAAQQHATTVIAFNNTCYGRLLNGAADGGASRADVSAADCYRFSLEQKAISTCLTAPTTIAQLQENLTVLETPALPAPRRALLVEHGQKIRREDKRFREQVRYR